MILLCLIACSLLPQSPTKHGHDPSEGAAAHAEGEAEGAEHGAPGGGDRVTLSPEALIAAALVIQPAEVRAWTGGFSTTARVQLDPGREARVGVAASGQVERVLLQPGDPVSVGTVLAEIRSPELGEAIGAFHAKAAEKAAATAKLDRVRTLEASGTSSRAQLAEAEAESAGASAAYEGAEERLRVLGVNPGKLDGDHFPSRFPVKSPVAGEVLAADVSIGQAVSPGDPMFHVGNLDQLWVMLDVFERDLSRVNKGQAVRFTVDAYPDEAFAGTVAWVSSIVEADSRTLGVRLLVDNADHRLKPGMFGRADLGATDANAPTTIVIPAEALQEVEGKLSVFVAEGGAFEARAVQIGERNAVDVQILSGLSPGEPVVVKGAFTLKSEVAKGELGEGHAH